jgi:hypothetical protein
VDPQIDKLVRRYFKADRSAIRRQYEGAYSVFPEGADPATEEELEKMEIPVPAGAGERDRMLIGNLNVGFVPRLIANDVLDAWSALDDNGKAVLLHHFDALVDDAISWDYLFEGFLHSLGARLATRLLHHLFPEQVFPIEDRYAFPQFAATLAALGVSLDYSEDSLPISVAADIAAAVETFRDEHGLEHWQMYALVYDPVSPFAPTSDAGDYPNEPPPRVWITAADGDNCTFAERLAATDRVEWTINRSAKRGDYVLMYYLSPHSAITAIYRCARDAYCDPLLHRTWGTWWTQLSDKLPIRPISLRELRAHPQLSKWQMAKTNFQGLLRHRVPDGVWRLLQDLVVERTPELGNDAGGSPVGRQDRPLDARLTEAAFEDTVLLPMLEDLGWSESRNLVRQYSMSVKVGSGRPLQVRADFVAFSDDRFATPVLVIESKRRIRSEADLQQAVEQCETYAGKLRCTRFVVAAPEALWVYDLQFPTQSRSLRQFALSGGLSSGARKELSTLVGPSLPAAPSVSV